MTAPSHNNRTPEDIVSEHIYHDARGFGYRAASWVDFAKRTGHFAAFHYACIDARLAIEHLIFEKLFITAGEALDRAAYQRCLKNPRKLDKLLRSIVPDYERLQEFTAIVASLLPDLPRVSQWNIRDLRKLWGRLSQYLHWSGAYPETVENQSWQSNAIQDVATIINASWQNIRLGSSGSIRPESMAPTVRQIWEEFRAEKIDSESARIRLELVRPVKRTDHT
ncbi:MAG: hypothetical protein ACRERU_22400 [Methylococcales bacterium]